MNFNTGFKNRWNNVSFQWVPTLEVREREPGSLSRDALRSPVGGQGGAPGVGGGVGGH